MHNDTSTQHESEEVGHSMCDREVQGGIVVAGGGVEGIVMSEDAGNAVNVTELVARLIGGNWEVCEFPGLK